MEVKEVIYEYEIYIYGETRPVDSLSTRTPLLFGIGDKFAPLVFGLEPSADGRTYKDIPGETYYEVVGITHALRCDGSGRVVHEQTVNLKHLL